MAEQAFNWRQTVARRILVAAAVLTVWTIGIEARLVFLQVISHQDLLSRAERQHLRTTALPAKRGEIVDRRGRLLAYSVDADTIYAVPYDVTTPQTTAAALCGALGGCTPRDEQALVERLSGDRPFAYVRRRVSPIEARQVAALELVGIGFMKESRRFYPNKELGAHLLGYVGLDNLGLAGLEATYDSVIRGKEGKLIANADARQQRFGGRLERAPTAGGSLELTIDEQLQYITERELRNGVEETGAEGGTAVVMDPHTGEILALANWPTFNPNAYSASDDVARRNRAVQDIYEPGSTFKVVTVAAALEEKVMAADAMIETSPGTIRFGGRVIDEYGGRNHGTLSLTDVIVKSSNVGAIKIGLQVGAERLGLYANRFGFGKPTSPDFPGETPGILWSPAKLNDSGLASMSMGYQVGVTALQMTAAMSAVANGGTWIEPRIVRAVIRDGMRTPVEPKTKRRVISQETTRQLLPILEAVVNATGGTGSRARLAGYTVAGKTGTADKLVNGRYASWAQNVSFLGFVPSRRPALTIIVMIDTPRVGARAGGAAAAPVFNRIAAASLRYLGVSPDIDPPAPMIVARRAQTTVTTASTSGSRPAIVKLAGGGGPASLVPDLRGMSVRDALRTLAKLGLNARVEGTGIVVEQTPAAGTRLERGITCTLILDRDLPRIAGAIGAPQ
ncbi:MAG TPA: penicillin-binding protein [Vicinamibacterales bacterium]|nr:penicillin-binding protein [Vicinamibacterales bacterium]